MKRFGLENHIKGGEKAMNHMEAVKKQAVERYLLKEMHEEEAQSFEQHYYKCEACTEELEIGASLMDNAREMVRTGELVVSMPPGPATLRPAPAAVPWFRQLWAVGVPAFAAVLLAGVVVYQGSELASLRQPRALTAYILKSELRGGTENPIAFSGDREIDFDLPDDAGFSSYRCSVYDQSGQRSFWLDIPSPPRGQPAAILIPAGSLRQGTYTLRVAGLTNGAPGSEIAHWKFETYSKPQ
jgi:hypothetical protein